MHNYLLPVPKSYENITHFYSWKERLIAFPIPSLRLNAKAVVRAPVLFHRPKAGIIKLLTSLLSVACFTVYWSHCNPSVTRGDLGHFLALKAELDLPSLMEAFFPSPPLPPPSPSKYRNSCSFVQVVLQYKNVVLFENLRYSLLQTL